jgi:hypothetical protein
MATIWTRPISSDVWHEGLTFDTSDLSATGSSFLRHLPEILVEEKKLTWKNFSSGAPTLSLHDDRHCLHPSSEDELVPSNNIYTYCQYQELDA